MYTVFRSVWVSAKFGTCTVDNVNGSLVEDKMRRFKDECAHFSCNKCPNYTRDGTSAKFSTYSLADNSILTIWVIFLRTTSYLSNPVKRGEGVSSFFFFETLWDLCEIVETNITSQNLISQILRNKFRVMEIISDFNVVGSMSSSYEQKQFSLNFLSTKPWQKLKLHVPMVQFMYCTVC